MQEICDVRTKGLVSHFNNIAKIGSLYFKVESNKTITLTTVIDYVLKIITSNLVSHALEVNDGIYSIIDSIAII